MALRDNLKPTGRPGVFYREHDTRRHGARKDRLLVIRYTIGGKTRTETFGYTSTGKTELEAERKISQFKDNYRQGSGPICLADELRATKAEQAAHEEAARAEQEAERNRPTIARLWKLYVEAKPGIKGIAQDRNRYKHYLRDAFGDKTPAEITALDLDRLRLGMLRGKIGPTREVKEGKTSKQIRVPKSPQTTKHALVLLRRLIRFGVDKKYCPAPDLKIEMPPVDNEVTEHLTDAQLSALLTALENEQDRQAVAVVKLALFTGMRRGELLGLRWPQVDLARALITIANPKGGKSQTLPISGAAVAVLEEVKTLSQEQKKEAEAKGKPLPDSDLVFPGRGGKVRQDLKRPLDRIRKVAGLPAGFRPLHGLRHHFASTLASSGEVDLYTLQRLLTHKDPATTQRYAHLRDETLRSAADVAARAVAKAEQTKDAQEG